MSVRLRHVVLFAVVLALAAAAAIAGKHLRRPETTPGAPITAPAAQSYLVILGVGEKTASNWDGSITAAGATITNLQGWRFADADSITGISSWKLSTRTTPAVTPPGPVQETG